MNSKAEYNGCYLPRITTKDSNTILKEKQEDDDKERIFGEKIREMKAQKCIRKLKELKEKESSQPTLKKLKNICISISNENIVKWKERKVAETKERKKRNTIEKKS